MLRRVLLVVLAFVLVGTGTATAVPRVIEGKAPQLHPEGVAWDQSRHAFLVGSAVHGTVSVVRPSGEVGTLAKVPLPHQVSTLGLKVDARRGRVLVTYANMLSEEVRSGLAIFDLRDGRPLHVVDLAIGAGPHRANDVTVDRAGNAYVTDPVSDAIYRVGVDGRAEVYARDARLGQFGNNGIAWHPSGYLVVGHYANGKLFRVTRDEVDEIALEQPLVGADGIAFRPDGALLVVTNSLASQGRNAVTVLRIAGGQAHVVREKAWPTTSPTTVTVTPHGAYVVTGYLDKLLAGTPVDDFRLDRL
ncbi:SMP-30/gluconolactonase/LRE family protein [Lentzea tibetensis]|uniref:SMP-30/gluconolactonase/LRE family protein n=1 Tax=Lentzea tibetensis TaxID=2591470 RepID=A0A563EWS2_9PSEU|nr:SMP-30/gluconolactonase/LRE family protein [Lentzea tibetensis]TWP52167.1 SMP-30/gluconolactonase/LRE family protein [Lentzea tibetensis]